MSRDEGGWLYRLGLGIVRRRRELIVLWALLFLVGGALATRTTSILGVEWGEQNTESRQALDLIREELGVKAASLTIVFRSQEFTVDDPRYRQGMETALAPLAEFPEVDQVITFYRGGSPYMVSADRTVTYAQVMLGVDIDQALELVPRVRERLPQVPGLERWVNGSIAIFSDASEVGHRDLQRAEALAFPAVLIALLVVFGSAVAAGLPVVVGGVSIALAMGFTYRMAQVRDVNVFVLNIVTFLGLGLAVDYSLLIVSRFREELQRRPVPEAVANTVATAGRTVLFSGFTVMLGLAGFFFFGLTAMHSLGIGGIVVTFFSLVIALTLLPALLAVLGEKVNAWRLRRLEGKPSRIWHRLAGLGRRSPWLIAVPVGALLLLLGSPLLQVRLGLSGVELLPKEVESRQGYELASQKLGVGSLSPILIAVRLQEGGSSLFAPEAIGSLYDFVQQLRADPRLERVESIVSLDPRLGRENYQQLYSLPPAQRPPQLQEALAGVATERFTVVRAFSPLKPTGDEAKELVRDIRVLAHPGLGVLVSGVTADLMDDVDALYRVFPRVILFVMAAVYLVLLLLFRSVFLPLKATVMNLLSLGASYGALVFIFQQGHLSWLLGFDAPGYTQAITPIIMFCILFGLSMDYEVFLLSRMKESYDETGDNARSVALGLTRTGAIITSAAIILALVGASFSTSSTVIVQSLGVGTAVAVLVDALVVRTLLVPALMFIMGRWNWWAPSFLERFLPAGVAIERESRGKGEL